MTSRMHLAARLSLAFLWVFTGITSAFFGKEIGYEVLAGAGITGALATFSVLSGSILDVAIGVWLLLGKRMQFCYLVQGVVIITYTFLLTIIDPAFWIHPFGPLSKNIPLLVMIYYLYSLESLK